MDQKAIDALCAQKAQNAIQDKEIDHLLRVIHDITKRVEGSVDTAGEIAHRLLGVWFVCEEQMDGPPNMGGRVGDAVDGLHTLGLRLSDLEARLEQLDRL